MRSITACLGLTLLMAQSSSKDSLPYRSFAGDFERVADSTQQLPMPERVRVFRSTFDQLYPGLYTDVDQTKLKERIERALVDFPKIRAAYDEIQHKFPEALASTGTNFRQAFPDFDLPMPIYLVHSLGTRDGGTDWVAGRKVMLFGADEMAQFHDDDSLQPFMIHELFHIEHSRHFEDCDQLWCSLWQEGLATYTAAALTPDASDHQLILDVPHPIRHETDSHWSDALCWTAEHFDSVDRSMISAGFTGGPRPFSFSRDPRVLPLPSRFGYYIGYRVAAQAAKNKSLLQLSDLDDQEGRPVVARALKELMHESQLGCRVPAEQAPITHHEPRSA
jgi:hypothetical protein